MKSKKKPMSQFVASTLMDLDELILRPHSGWVDGAGVLNEVDWFSTDEHKANKEKGLSHSYKEPFRSRGYQIAQSLSDSSWWGIRWNDAYEFISEHKGKEAAAKFVEIRLDLADRQGWSGYGRDGERRPRITVFSAPNIVVPTEDDEKS